MREDFTKLRTGQAADFKTLYKNARIIDPGTNLDIQGCLLTNGQTIVDFGTNINDANADEIIDCNGNILIPGIIDAQVHFREPGATKKETIETGSKSAAAGGITSVVCQPNTIPTIDNEFVLDHIKCKAADDAFVNIFCYASLTNGLSGQTLTNMESLASHELVVGFTDDGLPLLNSLLMYHAFKISKKLEMPIAQHAEDTILTNGGCIREGDVSRKLGVRGISNATEAIIVERDIQLLRLTGGHYHVLHVSTKESLQAIKRAKEEGLNITCEASPHHFTLTDKIIEEFYDNGISPALAKMNPPLRSEEDRQAVIQGLVDGTIDCIATDHAPHEDEAKNIPLEDAAFGIVGLETMLPLSLSLYHDGILGLTDLLSKLTSGAAKVIKKSDLGTLKKGGIANLTLFDLNHKWIIDPSKFYSKSKNSPFSGRHVKGKAIRTIIKGKTVYNLSE